MHLNIVTILIATVVQFGIGAVWYGPLFGKLWGKIHGFDKLPKEVQQKMVKAMGPFYALQALVTLISSIVLCLILTYHTEWSPYLMSFLFWIGFIVPAQVSAVIFGGTESKWIMKKILLQAGGALLCIEAASLIIHLLP